MLTQPLTASLAGAKRVLVTGAGGGYDVVCGLPLFLELAEEGYEVHLGSLSSTPLNDVAGAIWHTDTLLEVTARSSRPSYFPEGWLTRWLAERRGIDRPLWCFPASGVRPYAQSLSYLVERLRLDAVIVVDGGVDSLLRGDEHSLASPLEDALTLAAVSQVEGLQTVLAVTAFGAERLDGIRHAQVLARIADLTRADALLGVTTLLATAPEGALFRDAAEYILARQPQMHQSVVVASLLSALRGDFGEVAVTPQAENTRVWVSPLMPLYWFFDLPEVARQNLYLPRLLTTTTFPEAADRLHLFMKTRPKRGPEVIPL